MSPAKADIIGKLRKEILSLSGIKSLSGGENKGALSFMADHFPFGIFPRGAIHEFLCNQQEDIAASGGFISAIIATVFAGSGSIISTLR